MTIRPRGTLPFCVATVAVTWLRLSLNRALVRRSGVRHRPGQHRYTLPDQCSGRTPRTARRRICSRSVQAGPLRTNPEARPERVEQPPFTTRPLRDGARWSFWWAPKVRSATPVPLKAGSFVRDVAGGIHSTGRKTTGRRCIRGHRPRPAIRRAEHDTTSGSGTGVIDPAIRQVQRIETCRRNHSSCWRLEQPGSTCVPATCTILEPPALSPIDRVVM